MRTNLTLLINSYETLFAVVIFNFVTEVMPLVFEFVWIFNKQWCVEVQQFFNYFSNFILVIKDCSCIKPSSETFVNIYFFWLYYVLQTENNKFQYTVLKIFVVTKYF